MNAHPLDRLQDRLTYTFRDPALLALAVTHPSYLPDHPDEPESNQRLEFLGDAVVQLVLTEALFRLFPADREGSLSKRRAALSNGAYLASLARQLGLDACLKLGPSEEQSDGRHRASNLEDAFEALVGALYLDSDLPTTRRILLGLYGPLTERLEAVQPAENPKGRLQERVQPLHGNHALRYDSLHVAGDDHAREYESRVHLKNKLIGTGRGPSKKAAEESAARVALTVLEQSPPETF